MVDLQIECLRLHIDNATGHEHRIEPIALMALALLASDLDRRGWNTPGESVQHVDTPAVRLDLHRMSDAEAAQAIADAWLEALALKLGL
jgi:hypothetical protein